MRYPRDICTKRIFILKVINGDILDMIDIFRRYLEIILGFQGVYYITKYEETPFKVT